MSTVSGLSGLIFSAVPSLIQVNFPPSGFLPSHKLADLAKLLPGPPEVPMDPIDDVEQVGVGVCVLLGEVD